MYLMQLTGLPLIFVFLAAIALMIVAISKLKLHPFLAIMATAILLGLVAGIPFNDYTNTDGALVRGIAWVMGQGFSGIFTGIGIVILTGALIGAILEATGGAFKIADMVVKLLGKASPTLAMTIMGWIVSIPVFCDSGFVIINPVRKSIVKRTAASGIATGIGLGGGLYISHVLIPLTPGPLAASNELGLGDNLLLVIIISMIVSIPAVIACTLFASWCGKRDKSKEDLEISGDNTVQSYDQLVKSFGGLPNGFLSLAPILMPILFMALGSIAGFAGLEGTLYAILRFVGTPVIALIIGLLFAIVLLFSTKKMDKFNALTNETLKTMGPILFITAAGGVLGRVIQESDMVPFIRDNSDILQGLGLFFPFLVSAVIKTAQGSSTVAIITTAGIMMPIMGALGLDADVMRALTVMAIGAGAMAASHANDSYFWVVTNLSSMTPQQGYKNWTSMSVVLGLATMVGVTIVSLVWGFIG